MLKTTTQQMNLLTKGLNLVVVKALAKIIYCNNKIINDHLKSQISKAKKALTLIKEHRNNIVSDNETYRFLLLATNVLKLELNHPSKELDELQTSIIEVLTIPKTNKGPETGVELNKWKQALISIKQSKRNVNLQS
jgi:hypothetical protein